LIDFFKKKRKKRKEKFWGSIYLLIFFYRPRTGLRLAKTPRTRNKFVKTKAYQLKGTTISILVASVPNPPLNHTKNTKIYLQICKRS
jgi:hypothetical protein